MIQTITWLHLALPIAYLVQSIQPNPQLECQVLVEEPWPLQHLAVPQGSIVEINCTANYGDEPYWVVDVGSDSTPLQYQFTNQNNVLNGYGLYELPQIETSEMIILRLLINDTGAVNNQTNVYCQINPRTVLSTSLFIFNQSQLEISVQDVNHEGHINVTWSQVAVDVEQIFTLMIRHRSGLMLLESLNESYHIFAAHEGAPRCEVYNISVTANYLGATYTGPGCSVSSPVLSTMLPSLPNTEGLERSLKYSVVQMSDDVTLNLVFEPASDCEQYPISNYTLMIEGPLPGTIVQLFAVKPNINFTTKNAILENAAYNFTIIVSNSVGDVSTKNRTFYTTDVQMVKVILMEGSQDTFIKCEFIIGSKARGCMVMLTSGQGQESYHLMRNTITNSATLRVTLRYELSTYLQVEAFDLELNGANGSLAVPGELIYINPEVTDNARSSFVLQHNLIMLTVIFTVFMIL